MLIIDAELHPEVIANRLPAVVDGMGITHTCLDSIDVLALRGQGFDLLTLDPFIRSIEPGRYALVILDAWYRFLPLGYSENDNAQVMALYNQIDAYASLLNSAWVNFHHASKGDQSGKGTTDVGSGAGSQPSCRQSPHHPPARARRRGRNRGRGAELATGPADCDSVAVSYLATRHLCRPPENSSDRGTGPAGRARTST